MKRDSWTEADHSRAELSALADGEASLAEVMRCCKAWRSEPEMQQTWHAWAVIGDVMRSEDLVTDPAREAAFLGQLRARLVAEPVVLSPSASRVTSERSGDAPVAPQMGPLVRAWRRPALAATACLAVLGALVVTRSQSESESSTYLAAGSVGVPNMVRNAELDRYMAAHRQFSQTTVLATPDRVLPVVVRTERP